MQHPDEALMHHARFVVYNTVVSVSCANETLLHYLLADFAYFKPTLHQGSLPSTLHATIQLNIYTSGVQSIELPACAASKVTANYVTYRAGDSKYVDYHGRAVLQYTDTPFLRANLCTEDESLAHELAYLFLSSQIGLLLDRDGKHRVHALGFSLRAFHSQDKIPACLVLIPSGGGKSTLACGLLETGKVSLLSDDSPLVSRSGDLLPFPMRIGFTASHKLPDWAKGKTYTLKRRLYGTKVLLPVNQLPWPILKSNERQSFQPRFTIIAERWGSRREPELVRVSRLRLLQRLVQDMIVGIGLPQLAEIVLNVRPREAWRFLPIALSRSIATLALLIRTRPYLLRMSDDQNANARHLITCLTQEINQHD